MAQSHGGDGQLDDGKPRLSEDDMQRALLGPRGVPGKPDTAKMTPQQEKNMPKYLDPGHTSSRLRSEYMPRRLLRSDERAHLQIARFCALMIAGALTVLRSWL